MCLFFSSCCCSCSGLYCCYFIYNMYNNFNYNCKIWGRYKFNWLNNSKNFKEKCGVVYY